MKFSVVYILSVFWNYRETACWLTPQILVRHVILPRQNILGRNTLHQLFGMSEWRDLIIDYPGTGDDRRLGKEAGALPKEICVLPFPYQEALLQGETKQLRLYEDRFIQLFDTCMNEHCGVVAMGLIATSGIIQTVPIAEIEDYNRQLDGFGIFVTIRVVGRAKLLDIVQQSPYIKAVCTEITDTVPPNLDLPCLLASNIETSMIQLSSMEHRLEMAKRTGDIGGTKSNPMKNATAGGMDPNDLDLIMQHRIRLAKLEDTYYDDTYDEEDDDDEEDVLDSDNEAKGKNDGVYIDRRKRFRRAYDVALATDTQGYQVFATPSAGESTSNTADRTTPELVAISWAAFCTEILPEIDAAVRIQALDCDNIFNRLKLASALMRQKKALLRARMEKAGLSVSADDEYNEDSGGPAVE